MMVLAKSKDLPAIMEIYKSCTEKMNENGLYNWDVNYPDIKTVTQNIESGALFILMEGNIKGVLCIDENQPEVYEEIQWQLDGNFVCVHRLAINPNFQKQGLAYKAMLEVESWAEMKGYSHIRLDAFGENAGARNLYTKLGYKEKGMVHLYPETGAEYMCFEKILN